MLTQWAVEPGLLRLFCDPILGRLLPPAGASVGAVEASKPRPCRQPGGDPGLSQSPRTRKAGLCKGGMPQQVPTGPHPLLTAMPMSGPACWRSDSGLGTLRAASSHHFVKNGGGV